MSESLPLRQCSGCADWSTATRVADDGYAEGMCQQPRDVRDWVWRRASDTCGHWKRKGGAE